MELKLGDGRTSDSDSSRVCRRVRLAFSERLRLRCRPLGGSEVLIVAGVQREGREGESGRSPSVRRIRTACGFTAASFTGLWVCGLKCFLTLRLSILQNGRSAARSF